MDTEITVKSDETTEQQKSNISLPKFGSPFDSPEIPSDEVKAKFESPSTSPRLHPGSVKSANGSNRSTRGSRGSNKNNSPRGSVKSLRESVKSPRGSVKSARGSVRSLDGAVKSPRGSVKSARGSVKSLHESVKSPRGSVKSPRGSVKSPRGSVKSLRGSVKSPRGSVGRSSTKSARDSFGGVSVKPNVSYYFDIMRASLGEKLKDTVDKEFKLDEYSDTVTFVLRDDQVDQSTIGKSETTLKVADEEPLVEEEKAVLEEAKEEGRVEETEGQSLTSEEYLEKRVKAARFTIPELEVPTEFKLQSEVTSLASFQLQPRFSEVTLPEFASDTESLRTFTGFGGPSTEVSIASSEPSIAEVRSIEDLEPKIDRNLYSQLYELYTKQYRTERIKHSILESKVADYYRTRKMFHVLYLDMSNLPEQMRRYYKLLDDFDTVQESSGQQKAAIKSQIESLKKKCMDRRKDMTELFELLEKKQRDFGKEVKPGADPVVKRDFERLLERHLKRQHAQQNSLIKMRLEYIKVRNRNNELQAELDSLEFLGANSKFRLMDYEELRTTNRNLADKLEEREMDLTLTKQMCQKSTQTLAHFRERVDSLDVHIAKLKEELDSVNEDCFDLREQLSASKASKDLNRRMVIDLKNEVGLLVTPKLLRDMEAALKELTQGKRVLESYHRDVAETSRQIIWAREQIAKHLAGDKSEELPAATGYSIRSPKSSTKSQSQKSSK